jgi:hypothetical protein
MNAGALMHAGAENHFNFNKVAAAAGLKIDWFVWSTGMEWGRSR